jgi:hypothetical protein
MPTGTTILQGAIGASPKKLIQRGSGRQIGPLRMPREGHRHIGTSRNDPRAFVSGISDQRLDQPGRDAAAADAARDQRMVGDPDRAVL